MLTARVIGDKELETRLDNLTARMIPNLMGAADALGIEIGGYIQASKLSGQYLRVRSGALRRSIHHDTTKLADGVQGRVYSAGVVYARIQNDGGRTSAHDIFPRTATALAFMMGGRMVFARRVRHPGSVIKGTHYMDDGLADKRARITEVFTAAAMAGDRA